MKIRMRRVYIMLLRVIARLTALGVYRNKRQNRRQPIFTFMTVTFRFFIHLNLERQFCSALESQCRFACGEMWDNRKPFSALRLGILFR